MGAPQHGLAAVLFDISASTQPSLLLTGDHTGDGWEGFYAGRAPGEAVSSQASRMESGGFITEDQTGPQGDVM